MLISFGKEYGNPKTLSPVSFESLNLKESWLQDWVATMPEVVVGQPLLVITREFAGFETKERPDIIAIDKDGNLVIIELKRGNVTEDAATQAIKYAAYGSKIEAPRILEMFAQYVIERSITLEVDGPREAIIDFLEGSEDALETLNRRQRIILVGGDFDGNVLAVASWLTTHQVDIKCISLKAFQDSTGQLLVYPDHLWPPPEKAEFLPPLPPVSSPVALEEIEAYVVDPYVQTLIKELPKLVTVAPINSDLTNVYRRGYDFRIRMFGKNRAGYYFARRWLRFYLYAPSQSETKAIQEGISEPTSVSIKQYEVGFNVSKPADVDLLVHLLQERFKNNGEPVELLPLGH